MNKAVAAFVLPDGKPSAVVIANAAHVRFYDQQKLAAEPQTVTLPNLKGTRAAVFTTTATQAITAARPLRQFWPA